MLRHLEIRSQDGKHRDRERTSELRVRTSRAEGENLESRGSTDRITQGSSSCENQGRTLYIPKAPLWPAPL